MQCQACAAQVVIAEVESGTAHVACPDGDNPLTMEIRRDG